DHRRRPHHAPAARPGGRRDRHRPSRGAAPRPSGARRVGRPPRWLTDVGSECRSTARDVVHNWAMSLHESSTDPRTRRTLALLERAMDQLLRTQSISQINVSELCRVSGIHRTTFYKHFSSVAEFATYTFSTLIEDLATVSAEELPESADEVPE